MIDANRIVIAQFDAAHVHESAHDEAVEMDALIDRAAKHDIKLVVKRFIGPGGGNYLCEMRGREVDVREFATCEKLEYVEVE